ncbi:unnamed protein product [marine sediment metagenome]|uniref:Uncharacterized protein n=1 Tax=marine sediment metagenome TaxID=412755 RepID=X0YS64_9ZZZZ
MVALWHIYYVKKCRCTHPPKGKFVAVVCTSPNPYGFLVNSEIAPFIKKRPEFLASQVMIEVLRYSFLTHNSYIDCSRLRSFKSGELHSIQNINNNTRKAIKGIVSGSRLIEPIYKKLICGK